MTDSKFNLIEQLNTIEAFLGTQAHSSYVATIQADIAGAEQSILLTLPTTQEAIASLLIQHGRLEELRKAQNLFEDAQTSLKDRLDAIVEEESKTSDNKET